MLLLKKNTNKLRIKLHTINSKIKIAKYAKNTNTNKASIKFDVQYTAIRDWVKKEEKYLNLDTSKLTNKTLYKGLNIKNPELELKLINFI